MNRTRLFALLGAAIMVLSVAAPVAAAEDGSSDALSVSVSTADDGSATVVVTQNDTAVENASVTVLTADENATYDGTGEYATNEDGTVALPAPDESVAVEITTGVNGESATTTAELVPAEDDGLSVSTSVSDDGSATVVVIQNETAVENASVTVSVADENATYGGTGTYTTDETGAVALPAPDETVTVEVTAEASGETASATVDLTPAEDGDDERELSFGELHSSFVHSLLGSNDTSGPMGAVVAAHAVENNPGNAPDHAGPPSWLTNQSEDRPGGGPPAHAGPPSDDDDDDDRSGGPPSHAGPPSDDDDDDDRSGGPPAHAGPPGNDGGDDEEDDSDENGDDNGGDDEEDDSDENGDDNGGDDEEGDNDGNGDDE